MIVGLLLGCRGLVPLTEVEIDGGTDEQREVVTTALAQFAAEVGPARVALRSVKFREQDVVAGSYQHGTERVFLAADLEGAYLSRVVRHELCHALVDQEGLLDASTPAIDAYAAEIFATGSSTEESEHLEHYRGEQEQRSEAVAVACEPGPYGAASLANLGCDSPLPSDVDPDPALRVAVAGWILDHVWSAFVLPDPIDVDLSTATSWVAPGDFVFVGVLPTEDSSVIFVESEDSGDPTWVDVRTGEVVVGSPRPAASAHGAPEGLGLASLPGASAGWKDGPSLAIGT